jgi:hypothetical protein
MRPWKPVSRIRRKMQTARHKEALTDYRRQRTDELTRRLTIWRQQKEEEEGSKCLNPT